MGRPLHHEQSGRNAESHGVVPQRVTPGAGIIELTREEENGRIAGIKMGSRRCQSVIVRHFVLRASQKLLPDFRLRRLQPIALRHEIGLPSHRSRGLNRAGEITVATLTLQFLNTAGGSQQRCKVPSCRSAGGSNEMRINSPLLRVSPHPAHRRFAVVDVSGKPGFPGKTIVDRDRDVATSGQRLCDVGMMAPIALAPTSAVNAYDRRQGSTRLFGTIEMQLEFPVVDSGKGQIEM